MTLNYNARFRQIFWGEGSIFLFSRTNITEILRFPTDLKPTLRRESAACRGISVPGQPCSSIHQRVWVSRASICLKLCVHPHYRATASRDLFIWLLPSKLTCPLDRWPLCPDSRGAVSLSGTQELEGQLSGYSIYSHSLFVLFFTFSIPIPTPFNSPSCLSLRGKMYPAPLSQSPPLLFRCKCGQWPWQV